MQAEGRPATAFKSQEKHKEEEMLKETGNINKSLFTLGKVISALGSNSASQKKVARGRKYHRPAISPYDLQQMTGIYLTLEHYVLGSDPDVILRGTGTCLTVIPSSQNS